MSAATNVRTWPATHDDEPPQDHAYRSATWLLGRHPMLARLADRAGVVYVDEHDGELSIDLDELGEVFAAMPRYSAAWEEYEDSHCAPQDDRAFDAWQAAGPKAEHFAKHLAAVLPMSSGEVARLRLLAVFGTTRVPVMIRDFAPLDDAGRRLLADWLRAVYAA